MKNNIFLFILLVSIIYTSCERTVTVEQELAHWEYEHPDWEQIGYQSCGGNAQSPININTANTIANENMPALVLDYRPFNMIIVDNSHTIQVNPPSGNNALFFNGVKYTFVQLHFHHQSEHQMDGMHRPMELHCVHQDGDGNLLVLTFMITEGTAHPFFDFIFLNIPDEQRVPVMTNVSLDLNEILPENLSYYTYYGSLTTPPCSATVQFIILKAPLTASMSQINRFGSVYFANFRPVQPLNNRLVLEKPN